MYHDPCRALPKNVEFHGFEVKVIASLARHGRWDGHAGGAPQAARLPEQDVRSFGGG